MAGDMRQDKEGDGGTFSDAELDAMEREAIEALAGCARKWIKKMPPGSRLRDWLIQMADLDSVYRLEAFEARLDRDSPRPDAKPSPSPGDH